jgi:hypothetical protein
VLFQPKNEDPIPVFIDFASMINKGDEKTGKALPFCDYAKIERDLKTRMFLKEAIDEGLALPDILSAIHCIDLGDEPSFEKPSKSVQRLAKVIRTLRERIVWFYSPMEFKGAYNVVIAITSLSVLYREMPDTDISPEIQQNVAVETAITLLEEAQQILSGYQKTDATRKKKILR